MKEKGFSQVMPRYRSLAAIEYQWQFERTVAEISNIFISSPVEEMDTAIAKSLCLCGELFTVERSYIFQLSKDKMTKSNTHEWCAKGIEPQKEKMQSLSVNDFCWVMESVRQNEYVYIPEVAEMPPDAKKEQQFFSKNNISSLIIIAMTVNGEMRGFFGFDLPKGKRVWRAEQITLLKVVTGIISGGIAQLEADKELQKREEMFRSISENTFDLIALLDLSGYFIYCNQSYENMLGYKPKELIGKSVFNLIHPAEKNKMITVFREGIEKDFDHKTLPMRLVCEDGSFKWVECHCKKLLTDDGEPDKVLFIAHDVSDRKQAQEQLLIQRNLGVKLAGISDLKEAFKCCLDTAIEISAMDSGAIYLADQKNGALKLNIHKGLSPDFYESNNYYAPDSQNAILVNKGKPFFCNIEDISEDPAIEKEGITSFAVLPILIEGKVFACIKVASHTYRKIPGNIRNALETIAALSGSAIARMRIERKLQENVRRYRVLVSNVPGIIFSCEQDTQWTMKYLSGNVEDLTGYKASEFIGNRVRAFNSIIHPEDRKLVYDTIVGHQSKDCPYHLRYRIIAADGSIKWVRESGRHFYDNDGTIKHIDGVITDVTDLKTYEEQLQYLSLHDQLTGLYNRTFFEEELSRLESSREYPLSIISADLDGLKLINDTMGHDKGDHLLKVCADILQRSLRSSDILARVGGDEFAVILPNTDSEACEIIVCRIRDNIALYNDEYTDLPLSLSMGIATDEKGDILIRDLFRQADDLMYRDKLYSSYSTRNRVVESLMTALAERDYITEGHAMRLEKLCMALGKKKNLSSQQLAELALLARVHDLGKVGIPDNILFKPGILDESQWETMKLHPEKGYRIALSSPDLAGIADKVLKHHERWDGTGYPLGLKGEEIPLTCRILAIVDAFDAMTNDRPYKSAMSVTDAKIELYNCSGQQFDPHLVEAFLQLPEIDGQ